MPSIGRTRKTLQTMLLTLSLMALMSCTVTPPSKSWPTKLTVIELEGGGICFDKASAIRLAEFKESLVEW